MTNKIHSFVHMLQRQPVNVRKNILVFGSFGITALLVVIWLASFGFAHTQYVAQDQTGDNQNSGQSPFAIIKGNVVELYANATQGYNSATQK